MGNAVPPGAISPDISKAEYTSIVNILGQQLNQFEEWISKYGKKKGRSAIVHAQLASIRTLLISNMVMVINAQYAENFIVRALANETKAAMDELVTFYLTRYSNVDPVTLDTQKKKKYRGSNF
jgi:hypothetical protein